MKATCPACGKRWDLDVPILADALREHRQSHRAEDYPEENGERIIMRFAPFDITNNREIDGAWSSTDDRTPAPGCRRGPAQAPRLDLLPHLRLPEERAGVPGSHRRQGPTPAGHRVQVGAGPADQATAASGSPLSWGSRWSTPSCCAPARTWEIWRGWWRHEALRLAQAVPRHHLAPRSAGADPPPRRRLCRAADRDAGGVLRLTEVRPRPGVGRDRHEIQEHGR